MLIISAVGPAASLAKEPTVLMTCVEVEAMLTKGKEKASVASTCLDLKPHVT